MTRKLKILVIGAFALLIMCGLGVYFWMNQPVGAKIKIRQPADNIKAEVDQAIPIDTAYFSTTLPPGFKIKSQVEKPGGPQMIQIFSSSTNNADGQLAITVGALPSDGLSGISDFSYRQRNTDLYINMQFAGLPAGASSFSSKKGDNEITVFWPHAAMYAMISASSSGHKTIANSAMEAVIGQWNWK